MSDRPGPSPAAPKGGAANGRGPTPQAAADVATVFLSRLIGLAALGLGCAMLLLKPPLLTAMGMAVDDRSILVLLGIGGVIAGLAIVLTHNVWSRGVWPLVVTLSGWLILLRGALVLILPAPMLTWAAAVSDYDDYFYLYAAFPLVLGAYLTYRGFAGSSGTRRPR